MEEKQPLLGGIHGNSVTTPAPPFTTNIAEEIVDVNAASVYNRNHENAGSNQTSMVDSLETVTLTWQHVDVHADPPSRAFCRGLDPNAKKKHILKDVYGIVEPGNMLAIMGASQHTSLQITSGQVLINGVAMGSGIRNISAYVRQEDVFISTMTVREHLRFRALLRMENTMPKYRRLQRVEQVILEFGLTGCADTMIGDPGRLRSISGGEMRRLSFASEFEEASSGNSRYESPWYVQFSCLFKRSWNTSVREPAVIRVKLAQTIIISVVLGLTYLQLGFDQAVVNSRNGLFFLLVLQVLVENLFAICITFPIEVPVFFKEYGNNLYNVGIYFISKSLAELPSVIFIPCIFSAICYWMIGYIVSVVSKDVNMAVAMAPPLMMPLVMFGGFLLNQDSVPVYFVWLEYLSWFKYANEIVAVNQWEHMDSIGGCNPNANETCDMSCRFRNGDSIIQFLNYDKEMYPSCIPKNLDYKKS